jgi:hypothetical protein
MLIIGGCSSVTVKHDYDSSYDFRKLRTFDWMRVPLSAGISPLVVKNIKTAVSTQLQARGYKMTPGNSDFMIAMHIGQQHKIDVTQWGYAYGPRGRLLGPGGIDVYQYDEGTLLLDFIDVGSKELIWRGVATGEIDRYASPEKRNKRISEAVGKILEQFPPKKKSK